MKNKKRFIKSNFENDSLSSYENDFSSRNLRRRSSRVYKNRILYEKHGNKQLELWLDLIFGNNYSSNSNECIEEPDFVFYLPAVLGKIIFQYCAEPWDPYNLFDEIREKKKRKSPCRENNIGMVLDVVSSREKTFLLCLVPSSSNISEIDKKKFIWTVVAKEKFWLEEEEEVRIYYQIQRWDATTWEKCHERNVECFNNTWIVQIQLELEPPKKQLILFSSQYGSRGDWIIYIYDLETCIGKQFTVPSLSCIGGIYKNQLVYSYRSYFRQNIYRINKMDLTTKVVNQKMFTNIKLYSPWRINLPKYHPDFIFLFYLTKYKSTLQKVEIWKHCTNLKEPIATFDKCDEIWEFSSFPSQKEIKKPEIILGVCCYEEKKNCIQIDIWKISRKKQREIIQTYFIPTCTSNPGKPKIGKFLQISTNYFLRFTTCSVYIYAMKTFLLIQKLEFFPQEILDVFYSPIGDNKLWIAFKNGEVKIF